MINVEKHPDYPPEAAHYATYNYWRLQARVNGFASVDQAIRELYARHQSQRKVGTLLGVSENAIHRHLVRMNVPIRHKGGPTYGRPEVSLEYQGETLTIKEWSQRTGISVQTLHSRRFHWRNVGRILTTPVKRCGRNVCQPKENRKKGTRAGRSNAPIARAAISGATTRRAAAGR